MHFWCLFEIFFEPFAFPIFPHFLEVMGVLQQFLHCLHRLFSIGNGVRRLNFGHKLELIC